MKTDLSGANWVKSSHSSGQTDCVEVAWLWDEGVGVRDSKDPTGPALVFAPHEWDAFTARVQAEEFGRQA